MRTTLAIALAAGLAALTGCSASPSVESNPSVAASESATVETTPSDQPSEYPSVTLGESDPASEAPSDTATGVIASVKDACETFNALVAEYAAVDGIDPDPYEDIYLKAQQAEEETRSIDPDQVYGLFTALSLLSIDRASAVVSGGEPDQSSKDAVIDAVLANVGHCSAAGADLRL